MAQEAGTAATAVKLPPLGDRLVVKLTAPPVKGAANKALLEFLAQRLDLPVRCLTLVSGETSREKRVRIEGLDEREARRRLLAVP